ncbi:PREDICTED: EF-hand calcium-binding domain-containing protein 5-like [Buceros rhinoceros silvestris]|uniref:EF-hand calcium-binding domain-containing protein 5-like n=1 Tax=Buceros rhinoceros silvestris TaxID=175836 RepID=UPI0005293EC5|nr:PREDICTED: EF-hand calcium-binding domain-containing protein 5-like [Buceros rhinoceros silvestris]
MAASETKRNRGSDELPWLSNYAPWKECFYDKVRLRCRSLQEKKVKMICAQKAEEEKVKKREPCDWLAKEWLSNEKQSLDTRIYLLDKLLPTVIAGMEKLLMEVERRGVLVPDKEPAQFNPINFLGEYLMRHNPQHGASTKPGPYLRAMKMVTEELKSEMPSTTSERLARMKAGAKNRREDREKVNTMKSQVKEMRKAALAIQFKEWTVDVGGRIPVALVQRALRSFPGVIASTPVDVRRASCDRKLEVVDTLEKNVSVDEFTEYVHSYTEQFSDDTFEEVLKHLCRCADDFQEARRHDVRRQMFAELFLDCDYGKVGLLDRRKLLALLTDFYDRSPVVAKRGLSNSRQWPIIELQEIELVDLWGGLDQEVSEELSEQLVLAQTEISEGEILALDPADENRQGTSRTRVREGLLEPRGMSEAETGGIPKEENQATAFSDAELRKKGEEVAPVVQSPDFEGSSLDGDTIHKEKSGCHEDTKTERESESTGADRQEKAFPGPASTGCRLSKEGEPVAEAMEETPARKESFSRHHGSQIGQETSSETGLEDEDLLQTQGKDLRPIMAAIQNRWASCARSAFDESCLNLPQFVQLMETFVGENISLPTLKRLVAFLKEEYKQTEEEKMEQLEKVHRISRLAQRKLLLEALFEKWDNNASGFLDLEEVDAVLSTFKEGMEKEALRKGKETALL